MEKEFKIPECGVRLWEKFIKISSGSLVLDFNLLPTATVSEDKNNDISVKLQSHEFHSPDDFLNLSLQDSVSISE